MARYIYPAIFDPNELGDTPSHSRSARVRYPGDTIDDALHMAAEAMALHLYGMERDSDEIPVRRSPRISLSQRMQATTPSSPRCRQHRAGERRYGTEP